MTPQETIFALIRHIRVLFVLFWLFCAPSHAAILVQVKMVSTAIGWAIGTEGQRSVVLRTIDGGRHWRDVSPPGRAFGVEANRDGGMFRSADQAWVAGASTSENNLPITLFVWHTTDGGRRWHESRFPAHDDMVGDDLYLQFCDARRGALLALGGPSAGLMPKEFYTTTDGGQTWQHKTSPDSARVGCYPTGLGLRNAQEAWVTATYHGGPDAPFLNTEDGGRTWHQQTLPISALYTRGGYANTYPPQFFGLGRRLGCMMALLVNHDSPHGDISGEGLFFTHDGGKHWRLIRIFPEATYLDNNPCWYFADVRHGWVVDPAGKCLFATQDGGRTWLRLATAPGLWDHYDKQLDFVSPQVGWALTLTTNHNDWERTTLSQTQDGGRHWSRIYTATGTAYQ
jgi:photosystem II stability/assembly factor-like uncharacterized protein